MYRKSAPNILYSLVAIFTLTFSLSYAVEKTPFRGEINTDKVNLRVDATTSAAVISTLNKGERVDVLLEFYDWYKIRLPQSAPAYIKKTLAGCINYAQANPSDIQPNVQLPEKCLSAKVLGDRVNIRLLPDIASAIIGIADKNEVVNIVADQKQWFKIEPVQNSFGWVHKKFVSRFAGLETGCASVEATPQKKDSPVSLEDNIVLTGKIMPYGIVFGRKATHKLVTEDNKIFLLKGNRTTLNALNHQKVKVIGKVISPANKKYPVVDVGIIEVAS